MAAFLLKKVAVTHVIAGVTCIPTEDSALHPSLRLRGTKQEAIRHEDYNIPFTK